MIDEPGRRARALPDRLAADSLRRVRGSTTRSTRGWWRRSSATAASRGSARVLLATLAAMADQHSTVAGLYRGGDPGGGGDGGQHLSQGQSRPAGLRRADARGRRWRPRAHQPLADPRSQTSINPEAVASARPRPTPRPGTRPLLATTRPPESAAENQLDFLVEAVAGERKGPELSGVFASNPGQNRTVSPVKGPELTGVSAVNPGQNRTVCGETPPRTPPETPPPNARTGKEPQNPRTRNNPPNPPEGGSHQLVSILEEHFTPRGRQRQRTVTVDLRRDPITAPLPQSRRAHRLATDPCGAVESAVGASTFTIWLAALQLIALDDSGTLLLACPPATRRWVAGRYAALLDRVGRSHGHGVRLATDRELQLLDALTTADAMTPGGDALPYHHHHHQEAV